MSTLTRQIEPDPMLAIPLVATAYLDIIDDAVEHEECDTAMQQELRDALRLPDRNRELTAFESLYTGVSMPSGVPGLRGAAILHEALVGHRVFRRRKWARQKYTLSNFIDSGILQETE